MDNKTLWESIVSRLATTISKAHILSFFKNTLILEARHGVITIGFPNIYALNYIRERYETKILQIAKDLIPETRELKLEVKGALIYDEHPHKLDVAKIVPSQEHRVRKVPNKQEVLLEDGMRSKMFNPNYTLHNFIAGNENRLAHAACMAVAAKPGNIYNPLFLYGGVGLGKTHLLQATGLEILKNYPHKNIVYMTSERFINEIVEAIGKKHTQSFKDRYRKVDCLIVDDIQFFGNKATSQQEFFHTFNELYESKKQIIISSDRPPSELDQLEQRLISRFSMGMVVEMVLPDFETRIAILNAKCQEHQVLIDREILEFIAYNVRHSIRELEGILVKVIAEAQLMNTAPTLRSVAEAIKKLYKDEEIQGYNLETAKRMVVRTTDDVIDVVASYYKITRSDLIGEERRKEILLPRQICMYLIREALAQSYESIGESFGGRNHTTVLHACNKIMAQIRDDERIMRDVNALKKEIGASEKLKN